MSDCRYGVSPVNYPDPDPDPIAEITAKKADNIRGQPISPQFFSQKIIWEAVKGLRQIHQDCCSKLMVVQGLPPVLEKAQQGKLTSKTLTKGCQIEMENIVKNSDS